MGASKLFGMLPFFLLPLAAAVGQEQKARAVSVPQEERIVTLEEVKRVEHPPALFPLRVRRDAIGAYWFNRVTPLEKFELESHPDGLRIRFQDLALERGYADDKPRTYRYRVEDRNGKKWIAEKEGREVVLGNLPENPSQPTDRWGRTPVLRLLIQSKSGKSGWALPLEVILGYLQGTPAVQVLGWNHPLRRHLKSRREPGINEVKTGDDPPDTHVPEDQKGVFRS